MSYGKRDGDELVDEDAERVDVAAQVDLEGGASCLLGAHVRHRSADVAELAQLARLGIRVRDAREAEVEDLDLREARGPPTWLPVALEPPGGRRDDEDVRRLQVAVDDSALVGVADGPADRREEAQPVAQLRGCGSVAPHVSRT